MLCTTAIAFPASAFTTLASLNGTNGRLNQGGVYFAPSALLPATDGNLYGIAPAGGEGNDGGTVFKIAPAVTLTTMYSFCIQANCLDGSEPQGSLIQALDGNLFGTTTQGGTASDGTIFKITSGGTLTTLHSFSGDPEGANPLAGLIQASDGNFYGTTGNGGVCGYGTFFRFSPGEGLTTLYSFCRSADGVKPHDGDYPIRAAQNGVDVPQTLYLTVHN